MPSWNTETILTAFVALTGIALVVQAIILLAIFFSMRKAVRSLKQDFDDFRDSATPVIRTSREILERIAPHVVPVTTDVAKIAADVATVAANIKTASGNLAEVSEQLRAQTAELKSSAAEAVDRVRQQAVRADSIVTGVLDVAEQAGTVVQAAITVPTRQLAGILAGFKAAMESLRLSGSRIRHASRQANTEERPSADSDMFV
jgi:methyl-accepting chemotaxis protein